MMERQGLRTLRPSGFEPLTYRLEGGCSIQLSYGRFIKTPAYRQLMLVVEQWFFVKIHQ